MITEQSCIEDDDTSSYSYTADQRAHSQARLRISVNDELGAKTERRHLLCPGKELALQLWPPMIATRDRVSRISQSG